MAKPNEAPEVVDSPPETRTAPTKGKVITGAGNNATVVLPPTTKSSSKVQAATYEALDKQDKVNVFIPKAEGELPEMVVCINDVQWVVPRGKMVLVPSTVAEILNERLASESKLVEESEKSKERLKQGGI